MKTAIYIIGHAGVGILSSLHSALHAGFETVVVVANKAEDEIRPVMRQAVELECAEMLYQSFTDKPDQYRYPKHHNKSYKRNRNRNEMQKRSRIQNR